MKKLIFVLLLSLLATGASAQTHTIGRMAMKYDLDSTDFIYCRLTGQNGSPFGPGLPGPAKIKTSGSSATVVENTTGENPFANVAVGDVITVNGNTLAVIARADATEITVDTAVDLSAGYTFQYFEHQCGTGAEDGWVTIGPTESAIIGVEVNQLNATGGVSVRWECRAAVPGAQATQVWPDNSSGAASKTYTAAGYDSRTWVVVDTAVDACRLGMKIVTADDGTDTGADAERISAYTVIRRPLR